TTTAHQTASRLGKAQARKRMASMVWFFSTSWSKNAFGARPSFRSGLASSLSGKSLHTSPAVLAATFVHALIGTSLSPRDLSPRPPPLGREGEDAVRRLSPPPFPGEGAGGRG